MLAMHGGAGDPKWHAAILPHAVLGNYPQIGLGGWSHGEIVKTGFDIYEAPGRRPPGLIHDLMRALHGITYRCGIGIQINEVTTQPKILTALTLVYEDHIGRALAVRDPLYYPTAF